MFGNVSLRPSLEIRMARAKRALNNVDFATIVLRNTLRTGAHAAIPMQYLGFWAAASILRAQLTVACECSARMAMRIIDERHAASFRLGA